MIIWENAKEIKCVICSKQMHLTTEQITCSRDCHEVLVKELEKQYGTHKKIVNLEDNIAYKVPIRTIIEKGVAQQDLAKFPRW